jgi:hypothetical protein
MSQPTCETCRFWKVFPVGELGHCRRHPPLLCIVLSVDGRHSTDPQVQWPTTQPNAWCGEYEPKVTPAAVSETKPTFTQNMP